MNIYFRKFLHVTRVSTPSVLTLCTKSNNEIKSIENIRDKILNKSIELVPESGWTKDTIIRATKALGYPNQIHGAIESPIELIYFFHDSRTKNMSDFLDELKSKDSKQTLNTRIIMYEGVKHRLSLIEPVISRWPEAILEMSRPTHIDRSLWLYRNILDEIWIKAGDKSTDMSWYTKRAMLGLVYSSTEMYMLQDKSPNFTETWHLLDRGINETASVLHVGKGGNDIMKDSKENLFMLKRIFQNVTGMYRN